MGAPEFSYIARGLAPEKSYIAFACTRNFLHGKCVQAKGGGNKPTFAPEFSYIARWLAPEKSYMPRPLAPKKSYKTILANP